MASLARLGSLAPPCPTESKKVAQLPPLRTTLVAPDLEDAASPILELDEQWSFVLKKANDSWIGIALCRETHQVVAYAVGAGGTSRREERHCPLLRPQSCIGFLTDRFYDLYSTGRISSLRIKAQLWRLFHKVAYTTSLDGRIIDDNDRYRYI